MGISAKDRQYMHKALELAALARGQTSPNPMVGAVLVDPKRDAIVGQGWHKRAGQPHAEIEALKIAGEKAQNATLYINLEPCSHHGRTPPCCDAVVKAGVSRVVCAMVDPDPKVLGCGLVRLREADIEVDCGVLEGEARRLNEAFITFHIKQRPFVIAKWAMTLDGRTSTDIGDSRWISNEASRAYVHEIRSQVDAIGVGVGTIFYDNPKLTVRLPDYESRQPTRVIFDGNLRVPFGARCFEPPGGKTIVLCSPMASKERLERIRGAGHQAFAVPGRGRIVNMEEALKRLAQEGIQSILIEGGRHLHSSLIGAGLADKIIVFTAPKLIGGASNTSPLDTLGIDRMKNAIELKNVQVHAFGTDACIEGYINLPQ